MSRITIAMGLAALLLAGPRRALADDPKDLLGGYTVVAGEKDGKKEPKELIEGTTVRIAEDGIVVTTHDKKDVYASTYKIDDSKKPWAITMTSKLAPSEGQVAHGLIEKDGDTVRLIYALPGGEKPTEFKTKQKQLMFVLKNQSK